MTPLLDAYLPRYSYRELHSCDMAAAPRTIIEAAAAYQPDSDPLYRRMIALREMPMRLGMQSAGTKSNRPAPFGFQNFTLLERRDDVGLAYGLIGRFWRTNFGLVSVPDADAYLHFSEPGVAKLALGFSVSEGPGGSRRLTTETRVFCPDLSSRLKFAPYWYLIRPVSGLIRHRTLSAIKRASEEAAAGAI